MHGPNKVYLGEHRLSRGLQEQPATHGLQQVRARGYVNLAVGDCEMGLEHKPLPPFPAITLAIQRERLSFSRRIQLCEL